MKKKTFSVKNRSAVTLLEVIIAVVLIAGSAAAFTNSVVTIRTIRSRAIRNRDASSFTLELVEKIKTDLAAAVVYSNGTHDTEDLSCSSCGDETICDDLAACAASNPPDACHECGECCLTKSPYSAFRRYVVGDFAPSGPTIGQIFMVRVEWTEPDGEVCDEELSFFHVP